MKPLVRALPWLFAWTALMVALALLSRPEVAVADRTTPTTIWRSDLLAVTGVNQKIDDDVLKRRVCVGWAFKNLDDADTVYINVNNYKNPEPDAVVGSYLDQVVIAPGEVREVDVHNIDYMRVIAGGGDGAANLYWQCICHYN